MHGTRFGQDFQPHHPLRHSGCVSVLHREHLALSLNFHYSPSPSTRLPTLPPLVLKKNPRNYTVVLPI